LEKNIILFQKVQFIYSWASVKPSAIKEIEHPASQNMRSSFFQFLWVSNAQLDPDPHHQFQPTNTNADPFRSGSTTLVADLGFCCGPTGFFFFGAYSMSRSSLPLSLSQSETNWRRRREKQWRKL
jgi:hypothetical protein